MEAASFATKEELWRVAADVTEVRTCQIIHNDRIGRVERRQEEDARMKSVWGSSSPFPGVLSGTPSSGMIDVTTPASLNLTSSEPLNPQAEAFTFDQNSHLLRNLQLENEEEPRRGASRANSVRFDESTMHGHWGQGSRSSGDFAPIRPGSGLGGHPMTERSFSHRSDGRASLTGNSAHSTRANSLGIDTARPDPLELLGEPMGPPPGLFVLGSVPSVIRCWLQRRFSNETLLYACICTGAFASTLDIKLVYHLQLQDQMVKDDSGAFMIKMPVYLPEATVIQYSSKSTSMTPQVPALLVDFRVVQSGADINGNDKRIEIFIGSDTLRMHNADVLLSRNVLTLYDEEHDKLSIPLVRPENDGLFKNSATNFVCQDLTEHDIKQLPSSFGDQDQHNHRSILRDFNAGESSTGGHDSGISIDDHSEIRRSSETSHSPIRMTSPDPSSLNGETTKTASSPPTPASQKQSKARATLSTLKIPSQNPSASQPESGRKSVEFLESGRSSPQVLPSPDASNTSNPGSAPSRPNPSGIWGSWRRGDASKPDGASPTSNNGINPIGSNRGASNHAGSDSQRSRGRSMKVLKPSRSSISRSAASLSGSVKEQQASSRRTSGQEGQWRAETKADDAERDDGKQQRKISVNKAASGGSAFPWLMPSK